MGVFGLASEVQRRRQAAERPGPDQRRIDPLPYESKKRPRQQHQNARCHEQPNRLFHGVLLLFSQ